MREDPGQELDYEHGERSAEDEGRPALPRGECAERDEDEPGHRDCAGTRDDLGTKRVVMQRVDVQLTSVFRKRALQLTSRRRVRFRFADQRQEPGEGSTGRQEERREARGGAPCIATSQKRACNGETEQRHAEEDGGARVHEQHLDADRRERETERPPRMAQEEEEERESCGHQDMAVEGPGLAEQGEGPSVARRQRND